MKTISLDEIQRDFQAYLRQVQNGETIVIVQYDTPIAQLKPVTPTRPTGITKRPVGLAAGEFRVPDDFDAPHVISWR
jgi:antitoxin (DNA-binding transcriptional repressor) of toxin-antitoxin stability system